MTRCVGTHPTPKEGAFAMPSGAHGTPRLAYPITLAMLALALAFPVALMVFNPTLMFERGWEQYVGTAIYFWAVVTLGRELAKLWANEKAFDEVPALLHNVKVACGSTDEGGATSMAIDPEERRLLPARV